MVRFFFRKQYNVLLFSPSHVTSSTLQCNGMLEMYLFNLWIYVDAILNFQKYLETPSQNASIWSLKQSLLQMTIKTLPSNCTSHEREAAPNHCTIYKLTYISAQPLCPVCLPVIGGLEKKHTADSVIQYGKSYQQSIHFTTLPLMWSCKSSSCLPAACDLQSLGSNRTQISSRPP